MITLISVTQDDIDQGCRASAGTCPVALAVGRKIANESFAEVGNELTTIVRLIWEDTNDPTIQMLTGRNSHEILNSDQVRDFVYDFDSARPVDPFTFTLDIPQEYLHA